jgi:hypothetical protein
MTKFDKWLLNLVADNMSPPNPDEQQEQTLHEQSGTYKYVKNSFIVDVTSKKDDPEADDDEANWRYDGWVRWGWFEDNILNKFYAMISKDNANEPSGILNEFRSVNRFMKDENDTISKTGHIPQPGFESVKVRNHEFLESTNLKKYILPGQFEVGLEMTLPENEGKDIRTLSDIINEPDNFKSFAKSGTAMVPLNDLTKEELDEWKKSGAYDADSGIRVMTQYANAYEQQSHTVNSGPLDKSVGYLRNILVHTEFLKECFDFTENITINIGLQNMFDGMREDHNLWDWTIEADPVEASRMKIIDNNVTFYDWGLDFNPKEQKSEFNDVGELTKPGVFTFPVWQNNSIVKRQNLSAKLPSSMQMAAMYGVNLDVYTNLRGSDQNMSLKGRAAGALGKMEGAKDAYKSNADLAFRIGDTGLAIGKVGGSEDGPLTLTEGPHLNTGFFTDTLFQGVKGAILIDAIEQISETEAAKIPEVSGSTRFWNTPFATEIMAIAGQATWVTLPAMALRAKSLIERSMEKIGPPFEGRLASPATYPGGSTGDDFTEFIVNIKALAGEERDDGTIVTEEEVERILKKYNKRYDSSMKLKSNFVEGMRYLLDYHGESRANNIPVLIPLELELSIDGIGGIYPGNSYHSSYVPNRYQKEAIFQCFDVNHTVDSSGWTVSLTGKMRATLHGLYSEIYTTEENLDKLTEEILEDIQDHLVNKIKKAQTPEGQILAERKNQQETVGETLLKSTTGGDEEYDVGKAAFLEDERMEIGVGGYNWLFTMAKHFRGQNQKPYFRHGDVLFDFNADVIKVAERKLGWVRTTGRWVDRQGLVPAGSPQGPGIW